MPGSIKLSFLFPFSAHHNAMFLKLHRHGVQGHLWHLTFAARVVRKSNCMAVQLVSVQLVSFGVSMQYEICSSSFSFLKLRGRAGLPPVTPTVPHFHA